MSSDFHLGSFFLKSSLGFNLKPSSGRIFIVPVDTSRMRTNETIHENAASSSSATADKRVNELKNDVETIKAQLPNKIEAPTSNPLVPPPSTSKAATQWSLEDSKVGTLQLTLHSSPTNAVSEVL